MSENRILRVHQKTYEAEGVTSVTLVDPTGNDLPSWEPGAHIALHLPNGLLREYSLCSDPSDRGRWTVAVLRKPDSRGGSVAVHDALPVGATLQVDVPRNAFGLDERAEHHVLVAGGIGITPILAMTRRLQQQNKEWHLLYTGRSRTTMAYLEEIAGFPVDRVTIHADDEANGSFPDLGALMASHPATATVYCCGPEPLMNACAEALDDPARLRIERFKAPEQPVNPDGDDTAFDVVISSNGQRITVDANTSVLDALMSAGLPVPSSCTEGICGSCEIGVVKGDVDHRDFVLSPDEHASGTTMLPCVSRCRSAELVIDL
ncbi:PDR/VanB family oxidoreductase [Rhodococcus sp. DT1]|uniref:PDR/VanB family oxidoreductase n=1 Tax=Rhodococcus sp. DT1 TaxID=3416544 RepID=UPI003CF89008